MTFWLLLLWKREKINLPETPRRRHESRIASERESTQSHFFAVVAMSRCEIIIFSTFFRFPLTLTAFSFLCYRWYLSDRPCCSQSVFSFDIISCAAGVPTEVSIRFLSLGVSAEVHQLVDRTVARSLGRSVCLSVRRVVASRRLRSLIHSFVRNTHPFDLRWVS